MDQSQSESLPNNLLLLSGGENSEIYQSNSETFHSHPHQISTASINLKAPAKFFRKNREKMLAVSSSGSSQRMSSQRPARLRRLNISKSGTDGADDATASSSSGVLSNAGSDATKNKRDTKKSIKGQLPPLTTNQIMIRKLYERINRAYKSTLRESIKRVWKENRETLDSYVKKHHRMQSAMATSSILLSHELVESEDILGATLNSASYRATTAEKIKVLVIPEKARDPNLKASERIYQKIPVTTIGHVAQIPPVLDWTAIPHNLHEDDGKFLTNIPFLGDEFIDKDAKFIDEMVTLYEGKVHEAKDSTSFRKMDDEVLYTLVQAMMKIEAEEGPEVFKDEPFEKLMVPLTETEDKNNEEKNEPMEIDNSVKVEDTAVATDKITFSDVAAKLFQPNDNIVTEDIPVQMIESSTHDVTVEDAEEKVMAEEVITLQEIEDKVDIELKENQDEERKPDNPPAFSEEMETSLCSVNKNENINTRPSDLIFLLLSSTFKGLGSPAEIRERYETAEKVRITQILPILPNGMEQQNPLSYSIPNIEGPFAKYLPKEATMHAYHVLFCRRCFTYDCKRHTGDDQVDVKYYKNRQLPLLSASTSSGLSSTNAFNFLCKNPDCWQMNDVVARNPDAILLEWSPSDRSLFSCFIESFPSNYCFIAYMMRNKSCAQVKEYADLENVPKTESCSGGSSSRTKSKHRKPRIGFNKKSSGNSHSKRNITRRWINNVKKTEKSREEGGIKSPGVKLPPRYMPCLHEKGGECDSSCTCRINKTSCEKFCTCALSCPYRFPGCKCLSTCDSKRCICFAAARECDPDLCFGCGAHEHSLEKISCHNVNIQRKLHKHLLMGRSDISGWGIYIKNDAQKGEFIAEYRGELISHDESERRGHVYDKIQHTFLFELNDHFVVDATRKGNKARFVNSSKNPNCEVKRMFVNGDHRIGIYAKRFIEAGEELFYDYEDVLEKQQKAAEGANRSRRD